MGCVKYVEEIRERYERNIEAMRTKQIRYKIQEAELRWSWSHGRLPTDEELAETLRMPVEQIQEARRVHGCNSTSSNGREVRTCKRS